MATLEKLKKSLDSLKNLSKHSHNSGELSKKKDKIHYCYSITEAISNPTIRVSSSFHNLLGTSIELFLILCDDEDADIRMTSEECLNRIIRAANGYVGKIQIELHKEIKKNGATRSLRTALWLFSLLAHRIRPHKGKPYVSNLFPSLIKIAERNEEAVHETLAASLPNIMKALGCFTSESEIKVLLKAFLSNISNASTVIRRTTTNCIVTICLNCKNPYIFITYCLNNLLDTLIPVTEEHSTFKILGTISCLKSLIKHIYSEPLEANLQNEHVSNEKLLQIFELCLQYLSHKDHNIINICLETLKVLLECPFGGFKEILSINFGSHKTTEKSSVTHNRSPSQLSVATTVNTEDNLFSDSELTETLHSDIEKWIDESKLSVMNISFAKIKEKSRSLDKLNRFNHEPTKNVDYGQLNKLDKEHFLAQKKSQSIEYTLDILSLSDNSSDKSYCEEDKSLNIEESTQEIFIGTLLDSINPIIYSTRLITKLFLLNGSPGNYISDKLVRVSVKFLAISCLSSLFELYPEGLFMYLDKNYSPHTKSAISNQKISDVMMFKDHPDPQIRGAVVNMLGKYLEVVNNLCDGEYDDWIEKNGENNEADLFKMQSIVNIFVKGLNDESSICIKQTLVTLQNSLKYLIESTRNSEVIPLLDCLPTLAENPYWLVKVSLCELVTKISYIDIYYVMESNDVQEKVLHNILFLLLDDNDQRVRASAAAAIVLIIPNLFYEEDSLDDLVPTTKASLDLEIMTQNLKNPELDTNINKKHFVSHMPFPFDKLCDQICYKTDFNLSKIICKLCGIVLTTTSKNLLSGCIEVLSSLSNTYPCTVYKNSWSMYDFQINKNIKTPDLLEFCISSLINSVQVYGIQNHIDILNLASNLYAGHSLTLLKPIDEENPVTSWNMFENETFVEISEQYLHHIMKLLNIFYHVLNDLQPLHPQYKPVIPNLPAPSNLSPLKRRKSDLDKKTVTLKLDKEERVEKKDMKSNVGSFMQSVHYMKIYDSVKACFNNYKISLDSASSKTLLEFLSTILRSLSVLLEIGTITEFGKLADEILGYFRSTFVIDAPSTVEAVQQLLKCLFGTNLVANLVEFSVPKYEEKVSERGFYHQVIQKPFNQVSQLIQSLNNTGRHDFEDDSTVMGYLHRKNSKRTSINLNRTSDVTLANYIRIFEPMVIKSLKQYTMTSNVKLQCKVLQLLTQLVQLRVNYCLLDSEQVFIGFVLKQFEYIEEGQVPKVQELIPKIFQFLVQLSYSKQHSKSIIGVPKIIQLCDGLMASGQPAATHCIPALEPIVEDIFLTRNKSNTADFKELETTREVVLSMLLRLCDNKQVLDLITLILEDSKYCTHNIEKWYDWSKRVFNVVLPMFKQNKLKLHDSNSLISMRRFILAMNPEVFKPFDEIIVMFFQEPPALNSPVFHNWISKIVILLLLVISLKEDTLLSKIDKLKSEFSPAIIFDNVKTKADPLNVYNNAETFQNIPAELVFIKFILRILNVCSKICVLHINVKKNEFNVEILFGFLIHCSYMFQSGNHPNITKTVTTTLNANIPFDENDVVEISCINENFSKLAVFYPVLSTHWCNFLIFLSHDNITFWQSFSKNCKHEYIGREKNTVLNLEVMKIGSVMSFCDFLGENMTDTENITWFLNKNSLSIIELYNEPPVSEFITLVHRSPDLSKKFIENVSEAVKKSRSSVFKVKALKCVENCHQSQIGAVLKLIVPHMLKCHQTAVSRISTNIANRKIEFLFTLSIEEVNTQLSRDDLTSIQSVLVSYNLVKRNETLVSLLNKLSVQYYNLTPIEFEQRRIVDPDYIKKLNIDRNWYLNQIKSKFKECSIGKEIAELLMKLEYTEIVGFMTSNEFNKQYLKDCLNLGLVNTKKFQLDRCDLLGASVDCILKEVSGIISRVPQPHQVYSPIGRLPSTSESSYTEKMTENFDCHEFSHLIYSIALSMPLLTKNSPQLSENSLANLKKFSVVCLEYTKYLESPNSDFRAHLTDIFLTSCDNILRSISSCNFFTLDSNSSWLCSCINSLYGLVNTLLRNDKPLLTIPKYNLRENSDSSPSIQATYQLYTLTCWFFELKLSNTTKIPDFLFKRILSLTVCLARYPLVNSYVMIPQRAWKTGWLPEKMDGTFGTVVAALPIEMLQYIEVLEEYIFRINLMGWTTRQQFEETWMCLLSVLCAPTNELEPLELNDSLHASSLAVKSITALLLQTLTLPTVGDSNISKIIHISRNSDIDGSDIGVQKLKRIQNCIQICYENSSYFSDDNKIFNVFNSRNLEKLSDKYSCGQVSVKYLLLATGTIEEDISSFGEPYRQRKKILETMGLDVNSCLQFLIDYYTQLMEPQSNTHIRVLHEAVKSTVMISDLFTDKSQFTWMFEIFMELSKSHHSEDEFLHQYFIVGICKAVAVLYPDSETYEQLKKILVQYLKSPYITSRLSSLYGLLYILESCILYNTKIGAISEEMQLILPCAVEYVQLNLNPSNNVLKKSQEHTTLVWSLALYLVENVEEIHMEDGFVSTVLNTAFSILQNKMATWLHNIIMKGLERLLIIKKSVLLENFGKPFLKLALDKMKSDNPTVAILGTQFLLSYMYTDCVNYLQSIQIVSNATNPENLVQTIETISAVFERIKRGYVHEVEILCTVLPNVLDDFFSPADILTKVIGEFLSAQQPHPKLLSKVVFQVFQSAIQRNQLCLLQDWVVFSLSNFTQSFSIGMATWCLTCFFVSASMNDWLRLYFSYLQTRVGRYEYEDKNMLCIAGADFYKNLTNDKQRQTFVENFNKVKDQPDTPFNDLLLSL
ncbi:huntingtin [Diorhabda sublineata]|uniref:huntingtin n=1 Tax=Diorhabda sublineata TaxID=1163346 RepID=UPI0024E1076B|nr:huntingtin [Diorhabda sublineata]